MADARCPRCAAPLAEGRLAGQCPRCLGALAFGADPAADALGEGVLQRAGGYELLRELGRGGMGVVYEARQIRLNRRVAVKMLLAGGFGHPDSKARFRAEAEAAARLRHPNLVTIHEVGELEGQAYLAMELLPGPSLADITAGVPLAPARAARYLRLVAGAVAHAHAGGVLHRDLKPSNILLDADDQPRVTDFGLAKKIDADSDLTRTGEVIGSPNYLPPKQVAGHPAGPAGDIYALGAVLYQLLTGRPPFIADTVAATLQHVLHTDPVPPRLYHPSIPRDPSPSELDRILAATGTVWSVGFTEDSRTLVSGGVRGVRFWDIASGQARTDLPTLTGHEIAVAGHQVVGSPNHPFFNKQKPEPMWVLDLRTGGHRTLKAVGRHPALSPDGRRLAYLDGRSIQLMDLATETIVLTVATNRLVFRLKFSRDGKRLLAYSRTDPPSSSAARDRPSPHLTHPLESIQGGSASVWELAPTAIRTAGVAREEPWRRSGQIPG